MSKIRIYARNLVANWIGYGANMALTLVTSWFVFRLLGDVRYGILSLMMSLTGYLGMVDLGLRPALYRYFNWHLGRNEADKVNEVLCTSLTFFAAATGVLVLAGAVLAFLFGHLFPKAPPEYLSEVGLALVITAFNLGLAMKASAFGALLETHERYDASNILETLVTAVRSGGSILAVYFGFGLVGLAAAGTVATLLALGGGYVLARRVSPGLRVGYAHAHWATLIELLRFGVPCCVTGLGSRIIFYGSSLLIAWFIGLPAVGYYSLAVMLLEYGRNLVQKATTVFTPEIQQSLARQEYRSLRYFVPAVTRVTMAFSVLVFVGIMAFGQEFLRLFYGEGPSEAAGQVLGILGIGYLVTAASRQCSIVLLGAGRAGLLAWLVGAEAVLNVALTILLVGVGGMGLRGVAVGTAIPMAVFSGVALAVAGCRAMDMSLRAFARQAVLSWVPAAVLFWLICYGLAQRLDFPSWFGFVTKVAIACGSHILPAWFLMIPSDHRARIISRIRKIRIIPREMLLTNTPLAGGPPPSRQQGKVIAVSERAGDNEAGID